MIGEPERLSGEARDAIEDEANDLLLSAAAVWEISIKHQIGKLRLPGAPAVLIPMHIRRSGVRPLPIAIQHALRAGELPMHHRDPFDRLMVAQAQAEDLTLVSRDERMRAYEVPLISA